MTALEISDVTIERGGRAVVRNVDLRVPAGEISALLGPNGAGKSTLVLGIAGVIPLAGGAVKLGGHELTGRPSHSVRAAGLVAVPEGHRVFGALTVEENLRVGGSRLSARELSAALADAFELFPELEERRDQQASSLSGGQQQMLAIASALIGRPSFLLIDELSLGLAPVIVRRLAPVVRQIAAGGVGILLIEQFASVALGLANHAHVMDRGCITFGGSAAELSKRPELLHSVYMAA